MNQDKEFERLREEMKRVVYLFSHDMRNPLANMKALLSDLNLTLEDVKQGSRELLETELPETLSLLDQSVERMRNMIDGVNDIYHCRFDPLECEAVELRPLVARIIRRFEKMEGVEIRVGELPSVWGDPLSISRLVEHLLAHGLKAMTGRVGVISLTAASHADADLLIFEDSGEGVGEEGLKRLFDPSGAGTDSVTGLAQVKALAEAHGGSVRCESRPGEGSIFYLTLPRRET